MANWNLREDYWYLPLHGEMGGIVEIHIHPMDRYTERECVECSVPFDPDAGFGVYTQHADGEVVLKALASDLAAAQTIADGLIAKFPGG